MKLGLTLLLLVGGGLVQLAQACQICIPFPKNSAADYLIEGDAAVLAREDPNRPFHFKAIEVLKGEPGEEPINLFLDSFTRRLLDTYPERSVVLARGTEGGDRKWKRIATADTETEPVVRNILKYSPHWKTNPRERTLFFASLLGHKNPQIRTLAHIEVAKSPYKEIRKLRHPLTREQIRAFLGDFKHIEWHALYILLLPQCGDSEDHELIRESFRSAARFNTVTRLAALATAAIELDKESAIAFIETNYLANPSRNSDELDAVLAALSVHGTNGHTQLRDRIVTAYETLLATHPGLTPAVAMNLIAWKRTELAREVADYLALKPDNLDFKTTLQLRAYGRQARDPRNLIRK